MCHCISLKLWAYIFLQCFSHRSGVKWFETPTIMSDHQCKRWDGDAAAADDYDDDDDDYDDDDDDDDADDHDSGIPRCELNRLMIWTCVATCCDYDYDKYYDYKMRWALFMIPLRCINVIQRTSTDWLIRKLALRSLRCCNMLCLHFPFPRPWYIFLRLDSQEMEGLFGSSVDETNPIHLRQGVVKGAGGSQCFSSSLRQGWPLAQGEKHWRPIRNNRSISFLPPDSSSLHVLRKSHTRHDKDIVRLYVFRGVWRAQSVDFQFDINLATHVLSGNVLMASYWRCQNNLYC